jgi:hypothetical protein
MLTTNYTKTGVEPAPETSWLFKYTSASGQCPTEEADPYCGCELIYLYLCVPLMNFEQVGRQLTVVDLCVSIRDLEAGVVQSV